MKGKITGMTKKELREEILHRMSALDTTAEEFANKELLKELEQTKK